MIGYSCPQCRTPLQAPDDRVGTTNPCPRCGAAVQVPAASSNKTLFIVLGVVGGVIVLGFMFCCLSVLAIQLLGTNSSKMFQTVAESIGSGS
ncbi:MAG: hypothetical protein JNM56_33675 [Planctomycetia bacterium]|nr:hypothetical protein [Planctomycetia bacterium]